MTFKYVCIQLVRFLPIPFLVIILFVGGIGIWTSFDYDVGGSSILLIAILLIVVGAYLGLFFGLRPLARKHSPHSKDVEVMTATVNDVQPEQPSTEPGSKYASFWQRLGALLLDLLILLPLIALSYWGGEQFRLFNLYYFVPGIVFGLWFHAYLVKRYGGTPGKLIVGIKICKLDGGPAGYREATLRYSVLFVLGTLSQIAVVQATLGMSDADYFSFNWQERMMRIQELAPSWLGWITLLTNIWVWGEFVVMMTNKKRRAIHDFIAGTVVVRAE